ncbi:MAG TPA: thioesterase family protein [Chloroflexota bacterium]|nr:thioesterase family protein [Chloroflexota bacterium]
MLTYCYTHRIAWGECDSAGIVFYPNFYRWFDQGTHELVRRAGYSVKSIRGHGHDILLIETGCKYRAAGYYDDVVEIASRISEARGKILRLEHECRREGQLLCEGFEVRAYADISDTRSLKAVPMPEEMIQALLG